MDPQFWLGRWQEANIGFHQDDTEPLLTEYWPALTLPAGSDVLVPLCGKSLDMVWLAGQGHRIIGIELSRIAVADFFANLEVTPTWRDEAGFEIASAGPYELWCGDFFDMPADVTGDVAGIYDRAALVALPPEMRRRYAKKLGSLSPAAARTLLITLEYDQAIVPGPPHSVMEDEVHALFAGGWQVDHRMRAETQVRAPKFKERGLEVVDQSVFVLTAGGPGR